MSIFIFGDSHVIRLWKSRGNQAELDDCYFPYMHPNKPLPKNYKKSLCEYEHIYAGKDLPVDLFFSYHKGKCAWNVPNILNELNPCIKRIIPEDTTILPYFGYMDAKTYLTKYKDPESTVIKYMDSIQEAFPKNKIRYIEPIPQFVRNIGGGTGLVNFEERYPMHKEFISALREQCKIRGLEDPISPEKILGVDKLDESFECHECEYCLYPSSAGILWDHLKVEYNKMIFDEILNQYS
jgi:hypothetical protein